MPWMSTASTKKDIPAITKIEDGRVYQTTSRAAGRVGALAGGAAVGDL